MTTSLFFCLRRNGKVNYGQLRAEEVEMSKENNPCTRKRSRYQKARKWLIFWCLFIGLGAIWGGTCMLIKPDGSILQMQAMLPYFQVLPFSQYLFQDYIFSGIALLIVNGFTNLTAAYLLLKNTKTGCFLGMLFGITLMLWICIQFIIFPLNFLSTTYFFFGLAQAITGFGCLTFFKQEHFRFDKMDYPDIDSSSKTLVLYFSRLGYVRKKAYEIANKEKAAICEVKACERTEGTLGFWWCGRFGIHGWPMQIEPLAVNPELYEKLGFSTAVAEMDQLLGVTHQSAYSVCCKRGKYFYDKKVML